jgi:hypothetical protein
MRLRERHHLANKDESERRLRVAFGRASRKSPNSGLGVAGARATLSRRYRRITGRPTLKQAFGRLLACDASRADDPYEGREGEASG